MTYTLVIFTSLASSLSVTHVDGYGSLQACQSALSQIVGPSAGLRVTAVCISGPGGCSHEIVARETSARYVAADPRSDEAGQP